MLKRLVFAALALSLLCNWWLLMKHRDVKADLRVMTVERNIFKLKSMNCTVDEGFRERMQEAADEFWSNR